MLTPRTLTYLAIGLAAYALIELVESVGLWLGKRWGEYFAMVATSIFLPYEVYDLTVKITWLRVAAFVINVLLVIYLAWTRRLFGIRGGKAAYDASCAASLSSRWSRPRSPRHHLASLAIAQPHRRGQHNRGKLARIPRSDHPRRPGDHPGSRDGRVYGSLNGRRRPSATRDAAIQALTGLRQVVRPGGHVVVDSRNWEKLHAERRIVQVADMVATRRSAGASSCTPGRSCTVSTRSTSPISCSSSRTAA